MIGRKEPVNVWLVTIIRRFQKSKKHSNDAFHKLHLRQSESTVMHCYILCNIMRKVICLVDPQMFNGVAYVNTTCWIHEFHTVFRLALPVNWCCSGICMVFVGVFRLWAAKEKKFKTSMLTKVRHICFTNFIWIFNKWGMKNYSVIT